MRTWHVQLAIFFVATSYVAAGIFLAPMIARRETKGQHLLAFGLLGALALVVGGSMLGELAGIHGWTSGAAEWFGNQGWEYLDLGRFWQILLSLGIFLWVAMLLRVLRVRLRNEHRGNMPWLFFYAALAIPIFYASACSRARTTRSRRPTSGASGSCTCGWKTSSSSSRP
jgi:nitric oxide reductase subunit B